MHSAPAQTKGCSCHGSSRLTPTHALAHAGAAHPGASKATRLRVPSPRSRVTRLVSSYLAHQRLTSRLDPLLQGQRFHAAWGDQDKPVNTQVGKALGCVFIERHAGSHADL